MNKPMKFESWWTGFWKKSGQPEIFDAAMKELAQAAWNASAPETAAERDELKEAKKELLESLEECEEALRFLQDRGGMKVNPPALEKARAVIAKHTKGE